MPPRRSLAAASAAGVCALALAPSEARAGIDDGDWYGYQIAGVDLVGWGLLIGGATSAKSTDVPLVGLGMLVLGGPIVHTVHANFARGGISLGIRVGGPVLGAVVGYALDSNRKSFLPAGPFIGAFVGALAASIADIAILAYDKEDDPTAARVLSTSASSGGKS